MLVFLQALTAERRSRPITMPEFTTLITGLSSSECPRWRDGSLYVSDFYTHPAVGQEPDPRGLLGHVSHYLCRSVDSDSKDAVVKLFLEHGADTAVRDVRGNTPLMMA
jgi:hypothetical protein